MARLGLAVRPLVSPSVSFGTPEALTAAAMHRALLGIGRGTVGRLRGGAGHPGDRGGPVRASGWGQGAHPAMPGA